MTETGSLRDLTSTMRVGRGEIELFGHTLRSLPKTLLQVYMIVPINIGLHFHIYMLNLKRQYHLIRIAI